MCKAEQTCPPVRKKAGMPCIPVEASVRRCLPEQIIRNGHRRNIRILTLAFAPVSMLGERKRTARAGYRRLFLHKKT